MHLYVWCFQLIKHVPNQQNYEIKHSTWNNISHSLILLHYDRLVQYIITIIILNKFMYTLTRKIIVRNDITASVYL